MVCNSCQQKTAQYRQVTKNPADFYPASGYDPSCDQYSRNVRLDTHRTMGQSILGRNITGRSTAGYDVRGGPDGMYGAYVMGGPSRGGVIYDGMSSPVPDRMGKIIPSRPMQQGRAVMSAPKKLENGFPWTPLVAGGILGLIFGYFVFTESGRRIGYEAGRRAARKVKG